MTKSTSHDIRQKMAALLDAELVARGRQRYEASRSSAETPDRSVVAQKDNHSASSNSVTEFLRRDVLRLAAEALEMQESQIDPQENLTNFGVDSIAITEVMVQISRFFGISIAPTTFFEAKHLNHLSDILANRYNKAIDAHYTAQLTSDDKECAVPSISANKAPKAPAAWLARHKKLGAELKNVKAVNLNDANTRNVSAEPEKTAPKRSVAQTTALANEPVAVIAMDGMFPKSPDIETLARNLSNGIDCIEEVPGNRWDWRAVDGDPKKGAFTRVKHGGFVADHDLFDASFFNISPREAELIDPQHRLFMLSVWRLIEGAGYASGALSGRKVSIFLGINLLDHVAAVNSAGIMEAQQMTGLGHAFCPNRLSFMLDVHGPSEVVDTACSSSLVALHRAVMSIRHEGCEMAIVGGSNLMLGPKQHILFSKTGMLAADGRSKTFSRDADGYGRADGVGAVLLKPLSKAERDGDQILGLITGTAEQHSGQGSSLTAPNSSAQARMIVEAHRRAGTDPRAIGYVECHGTGTPLGDPAEVEGLKLAFAQRFKDIGVEQPLDAHIGLGSIKSNIGHTETAAGIAGVVKLLLSMRAKTLFKTLHCEEVNPLLDLEGSPFYLLQSAREWDSVEIADESMPRTACISSFGAGGGNAHVVIEEYRPRDNYSSQQRTQRPLWADGPVVVPLSARNEAALKKIAANILAVAADHSFTDLAYTLQVGRDAMRERVAFVVENTSDLKKALTQYLEGDNKAAYERGTVMRSSDEGLDPTTVEAQQVAKKWLTGCKVDWSKYYKDCQPQRLSLPTYPYALKRFSLPVTDVGAGAHKTTVSTPAEKPLAPQHVGDNTYELELTGAEPFLTDHVIMGKKTLPGVAYLEIAQQAGTILTQSSIILRKIVWLKPMIIESNALLSIVFSEQGNHEWLARIYAKVDGLDSAEYAQIKVAATVGVSTASIDLHSLEESDGVRYDADALYTIFGAMGLSYGPSHQTVSEIKCIRNASGERHVIGMLNISGDETSTLSDFALHPGLMDGAFQTVVGLGLGTDSHPSETALPFAVDSVEYIKPLQSEMWVHVRSAGAANSGGSIQRSDIDLVAGNGDICVRFKGFTARLVKTEQKQPQETHIFKPQWSEVVPAHHSDMCFDTRHLIAFAPHVSALKGVADAGKTSMHDLGQLPQADVAEAYKDMCANILGIIQDITVKTKLAPQLLQILLPDTSDMMPFTGIVGMLRTLRKEYPKVSAQLISVNDDAQHLLERTINNAALMGEVSWLRLTAHGNLEQHQWVLDAANQNAHYTEINNGKVYLITGGSGGIARQLTRYILDTAPESHIVLTSRSNMRLSEVDWLDAKERDRVSHICADITQKDSVGQLIKSIKSKHSRIHGVFHAAGILDDGALSSKTTESLRAVLSPKVDGITCLDNELAGEDLDFMVLFSSIACALGNAGQADYAAANGFLDGFAEMRERRRADGRCHGKTVSIAWPLWRSGGMQLSHDAVAGMTRTTGLTLLESDAAIKAMLRLLAEENPHALVTAGNKEKVTTFVIGATTSRPAEVRHDGGASGTDNAQSNVTVSRSMSIVLMQALKSIVSDELKVPSEELDADEQLSEYGFDSIGFAQLANAINERFGLDIIPTLFFECPTLAELTDNFISNYGDIIGDKLGIAANDEEIGPKASAALPPKVLPKAAVSNEQQPKPKLISTADDPIVIVGMSCQYPGADNVEDYWQNLLGNKDLMDEIPADRWDWRDYWGDPLKEPGRTNIKWGGFIDDVGAFDPDFFGISRPEARLIDPQQRLLLHQVWRLFENAGHAPKSFSGSDTGVFLGIADSAYSNIVAKDVEQIEGYTMAGLAPSLGPNRISYFYNLHGPSVAVETACSSALIAVHRAVEAIEAGRCSSAIAGGVNLLLSPHTYIGFSKAGMLAQDGRCKTFSAEADGYARGEGLGLILLKRLSEAERDGDTISAIVRASGENHGGFATSLTAPNPKAQANLLRDVYRRSGVDPRTVSYIEAHGTGTPMGDPIEVEALTAAFADLHSEAQSKYDYSAPLSACGLGSVKSNIGHLEIAAGIAGLMKVVLQMQNGTLVKSLHTERLNPYLKLDDGNFFVVDRNQPWQRVVDGDGAVHPYRAGVSSFGFGGSNAHIVLEEYVVPDRQDNHQSAHAGPYLIPLSARTEDQLKTLAKQLSERLHSTTDELSDIAFTLQVGREEMSHRLAVLCKSKNDLAQKLSSYCEGAQCPDRFEGSKKSSGDTLDIIKSDAHFRLAAEQSVASGNFQTIASLWVRGFDIDWQTIGQNRSCRKVALPGYPFDTAIYWGLSQSLSAQKAQNINEHRPISEGGLNSEMALLPDKHSESPGASTDQILIEISELAASVLEVDVSALDVHAELGDFGFDSIVMTTFAGQVNDSLNLDLSPADFFEFSTLSQLADHIAATTKVRLTSAAQVIVTSTPDSDSFDGQKTNNFSSNNAHQNDPIVIVGYSCNFPGARDADQFWQNLKAGKESIVRVPSERWDWQALDGDPKTEAGKTNVHWGGFCDGMLEFDPAFFNISPREAVLMDPQQRLLMTYVWKAIEDAGHDPTSFAGKKLGIFAGTASSDYRQLISDAGGDEAYVATGSVASVGPNRMSYFLDLHGPSEPVETACSSSLVAMHRAVQSIKNGECEAAVAGGVNTMITPDAHINFSKAGMLSPDGHCKTFSKDANGYVRGEGVGFILLKKLSAAKRDGDRVLAIVKASGINHGGHANSLTAPNTSAQAALLRDTYASTDINPYDIGYIEAHGTGTPLGDPVEINGLKSAFGDTENNPAQGADRTCFIGSVKTNIGHLELAAGVAGIIKTLLQIEHKMLVPSLHSENINPHIKLDASPFQIIQKQTSWEPFRDNSGNDMPRLAGVSSFGFGGVNAHIVLEEYIDAGIAQNVSESVGDNIFVLSAKSQSALKEQAKTLCAALSVHTENDAQNIAYTLQQGRAAMPHRLAVVASSLAELQSRLNTYLLGTKHEHVFSGLAANMPGETGVSETEKARPEALAAAWTKGQTIDWLVYHKAAARRIKLPTYAFARDVYHIAQKNKACEATTTEHEVFDGHLKANAFYLRDHKVQDKHILPGAMGLEIIRSKYTEINAFRPVTMKNINWLRPFELSHGSAAPLVSFKSNASGGVNFAFEAEGGGPDYMRGQIMDNDHHLKATTLDINGIQSSLNEKHALAIYDQYRSLGITYGPTFQVIKSLYAAEGKALAYLRLEQEAAAATEFALNPAILDGAFHAALGLFDAQSDNTLALPVGLEQLDLYHPLKPEMWAYLTTQSVKNGLIKLDIDLADADGRLFARIKAFTLKTLPKLQQASPSKPAAHAVPMEAASLEVYFKSMLSGFTDIPAENIDLDAPLEQYGMDSLLLTRMTEALEAEFGELPATLFFDHLTLGSLLRYFAENHADKQEKIINQLGAVPLLGGLQSSNQAIHEPAPPLSRDDDIAIVGLSGRYPQAENLDQFWQNLVVGKDCITEIPKARWDHDALIQSAKDAKLNIKSRWGGFISGADQFDPLFFNISPSEAAYLDPQERLFMQCAWETIEDAGYTRRTLAPMAAPLEGSHVGVFVGVMWQEYQLYGAQRYAGGDAPIAMSGNGSSVANRVSYFCNFHGPSMMVDTMCSSSLTAVHLAIDSIKSGSCSAAIAGGVNLSSHPNKYVGLAQANFLSPNGRCESFGQGGDGYVPSEGVGAVLLKPLRDAVADKDQIYGVIRGSELNHGGRVNGYTVPNPHAQAAVIGRALDRASVDAGEISYVEAHGTGTVLGDPIEVAALTRAYGAREGGTKKCAIGSVKSNIGHAESAAGIAGLTKILLQFKYDQLVPSIHAETLNPKISFEDSPFTVQREGAVWKRMGSESRIAGLSSFGAGGSNAHFVIEDFKHACEQPHYSGPFVIPFSAHDQKALENVVSRFSDFITKLSDSDLASAAYTLQVGREAFDYRLALVVKSIRELKDTIGSVLKAPFGTVKDPRVIYNHAPMRKNQDSSSNPDPHIIANAWCDGAPVDWALLWQTQPPVKISLPTYPFAREPYWVPGIDAPSNQKTAHIDQHKVPLLYAPHWFAKDIDAAPRSNAENTQLVLCHVPSTHSQRFEKLVAKDKLHIWHSDKTDIAGTCINEYAANLLALLKTIEGQSTKKSRVLVVVNAEQDGSYLQGLAGMLRSAGYEIPHLSAQFIEYEADSLDHLVFNLACELGQSQSSAQVRYSNGGRLERYWQEVPAVTNTRMPWKDNGVYLITGGAGGIGLHMAREIARTVDNASLWLIGRSQLSSDKQQELKALSASVNYRAVDVTSEHDVIDLVSEIRAAESKIDGVIHSAGLTRDGMLRTKSAQDLHDVLVPKVDGTLNLDKAIGNEPLDFILLMSSVAGAVGNAGQTDYAAANAFLDGYAAHRNMLHREGKRQGRTLSIDWPYWRDGGIQLDDHYINIMQRDYGVWPLELPAALMALSAAFDNKVLDQMLVLSGEHSRLRSMMSAQIAPTDDEGHKPSQTADETKAHKDETPTAANLGRRAICDLIVDAFVDVLGIPADRLDHHKTIDTYGVDSVSALNILEPLSDVFGELPQTILFEYPTIHELADYLSARNQEHKDQAHNRHDDESDGKPQDLDQNDGVENTHTESPWLDKTPQPWASPMGEGQRGIWVAQLMQPESSFYNVPMAFQLRDIDQKLLKQACAVIYHRYPLLSARLDDNGAKSPMMFAEVISEPLVHVPMSKGVQPSAFLKYRASIPFDLRRAEKIRFEFLTGGDLTEQEAILLVVAHHLVIDATSMAILANELWDVYRELLNGNTPPETLNNGILDYAHYIAWEKAYISSEKGRTELAYWRDQLDHDVQKLQLPYDLEIPANAAIQPQTIEYHLSANVLGAAEAAARLIGVSKATFFMGVFSTLLYKYTGQSTFMMGVPTMRRSEKCFEKTVGYCANMLPLIVDVNSQMTTDVFFKSLHARLLSDLTNGNVPFTEIASEAPVLQGGETPFQATFCYLNIGGGADTSMQFEQGSAEVVPEIRQSNDSPLGVDFFEHTKGLDAVFSYDSARFSAVFMQNFMDHFQTLLTEVTRQPSATIANQVLLSPEEVNMRCGWGDTGSITKRPPSVIEAIRMQTHNTPDACAISCGNDTLSYNEMMRRTNKLSNYLLSQGVRPEDTVAVLLERTTTSVITLLAVMSLGAVWVPLDSEGPDARNLTILDNTSVRLIVTQSCFEERVIALGLKLSHVVILEYSEENLEAQSTQEPDVILDPSCAAYIIHTSGSTGEPKGVVISQAAIAEHTSVISKKYGLRSGDNVLQFASHTTDTALEQIIPTLASGATLVVAGAKLLAPKDFYELLLHQKITVADIPPAYLRELLLAWRYNEDTDGSLHLRLILLGGEALTADLITLWQDSTLGCVKLLNAYGPTEATITTLTYEVERDHVYGGVVPIGRPLEGVRAYILDEDGNMVPEGVKGELYLGGNRLALGYLNNDAATAARFPLIDLGAVFGRQRLYKTGDSVSHIIGSNGAVAFHGRIDNQVKVRGYRVEPGEVEAKILDYDDSNVVVLSKPLQGGDAVLVAYVEAIADSFDKDGLLAYLKRELPDHMVPSRIIYMNALPITGSGKVDRVALKKLELTRETTDNSSTPPTTGLEHELLRIWRIVLDDPSNEVVDSVTVPFDQYGGNSLSAVRLMDEISKSLNIRLSYADVRTATTIADQAGLVSKKLNDADASALGIDPLVVPLKMANIQGDRSTKQEKKLFLLHPIGGEVTCYGPLADQMPSEFAVYGLRACDLKNYTTVDEMVGRYVEAIESVQPSGPYHIAGWSFGGVLAYEIAGFLSSNDDEEAFTALLDSYPYDFIEEAEKNTQTDNLIALFSRDIIGLIDPVETLKTKQLDSFDMLAEYLKSNNATASVSAANLQAMFDIFVRNHSAFKNHSVSVQELRLSMFFTQNDYAEPAARYWQRLAGVSTPQNVYSLPGDHYSFLQPDNLPSWIHEFSRALLEFTNQRLQSVDS